MACNWYIMIYGVKVRHGKNHDFNIVTAHTDEVKGSERMAKVTLFPRRAIHE
jgi:hypothetical protein